MWLARLLRYGMRLAVVTLIGGTLVAYLGWHILYGRKGLLALEVRERELSLMTERHAAIRQDREALEHRVSLLRRPVDADMLEEQAQRVLNTLNPDQRVLWLADLLSPPP